MGGDAGSYRQGQGGPANQRRTHRALGRPRSRDNVANHSADAGAQELDFAPGTPELMGMSVPPAQEPKSLTASARRDEVGVDLP
jgi:hypothetical protein